MRPRPVSRPRPIPALTGRLRASTVLSTLAVLALFAPTAGAAPLGDHLRGALPCGKAGQPVPPDVPWIAGRKVSPSRRRGT